MVITTTQKNYRDLPQDNKMNLFAKKIRIYVIYLTFRCLFEINRKNIPSAASAPTRLHYLEHLCSMKGWTLE